MCLFCHRSAGGFYKEGRAESFPFMWHGAENLLPGVPRRPAHAQAEASNYPQRPQGQASFRGVIVNNWVRKCDWRANPSLSLYRSRTSWLVTKAPSSCVTLAAPPQCHITPTTAGRHRRGPWWRMRCVHTHTGTHWSKPSSSGVFVNKKGKMILLLCFRIYRSVNWAKRLCRPDMCLTVIRV